MAALTSAAIFGPLSYAQAAEANRTDPLDAFMAYRGMVEAEQKSFLDFVKMTVGGAVLLAGAFLGFMNWRTSDAVRKTAEAQLAGAVETQLARAVTRALDTREAAIQEEITKQIQLSIAEQKSAMEAAFAELNAELEKRRQFTERWLYDLSQAQASQATSATANNPPTRTVAATLPADESDLSGVHILWVDDNPENNVEQARILRSFGASVESVLSTAAALERLADPGRYRLVISDMGRRGEGERAGINFLQELRARGINLPVIVFCGARTLRQHGDEAVDAGAFAVTAANSALFRAVNHAAHGGQPMGVLVA